MITPAISVLSAVEGLKVVDAVARRTRRPDRRSPSSSRCSPIQRFGTGAVGRLFGPVMVVWFTRIGVAWLCRDRRAPGGAAGPVADLRRRVPRSSTAHGVPRARLGRARGHGRRGAVRRHGPLRSPADHARVASWSSSRRCMLNYLGQGALSSKTRRPSRARSSCSCPDWAPIPMVLLATAATVIASQAVISGAFSVDTPGRPARLPAAAADPPHLGGADRADLRAVDELGAAGRRSWCWSSFGSLRGLASAYGMAVTGTLTITTILFFSSSRVRWRTPLWLVLAGGAALPCGRPPLLRREPHQAPARRLAPARDRR